MAQLPAHFLEVAPGMLRESEPFVPQTEGLIKSHPFVLGCGYERERDWLENIKDLLSKEELAKDDAVSWAAYCASQASLSSYEPAIISLLALFVENGHSTAMILHAMNVIRSALKHGDPVQVPVIAFDQPLFALAKQIQWELPNTHGEDHLVVMFHALHVEMAAFKALGKWLTGSGWTEVLSKPGIATPGVSDLSLTASHLTKTRRTHQITAAALHLLQHQAYSKFTENSADDDDDDDDDEVMTVAIEEWKSQMSIIEDSFLTSRILAVFLFYSKFVQSFQKHFFP